MQLQLPKTVEVKGIRVLTTRQLKKVILDNVARYDI